MQLIAILAVVLTLVVSVCGCSEKDAEGFVVLLLLVAALAVFGKATKTESRDKTVRIRRHTRVWVEDPNKPKR